MSEYTLVFKAAIIVVADQSTFLFGPAYSLSSFPSHNNYIKHQFYVSSSQLLLYEFYFAVLFCLYSMLHTNMWLKLCDSAYVMIPRSEWPSEPL